MHSTTVLVVHSAYYRVVSGSIICVVRSYSNLQTVVSNAHHKALTQQQTGQMKRKSSEVWFYFLLPFISWNRSAVSLGFSALSPTSTLFKHNMPNGIKKENLPTKVCVVCKRPFMWRKKWERCWDEVTTCSKSCNAARRKSPKGSGFQNEALFDLSKLTKPQTTTSCAMCDCAAELFVRCKSDAFTNSRILCGQCWDRASDPGNRGEVGHLRFSGLISKFKPTSTSLPVVNEKTPLKIASEAEFDLAFFK